MEDKRDYHPSHPNHQLVLRNFDKPFHCDGCKEQGFGKRYRCEESQCDYVLHVSCMRNSRTSTHDFYPDCTLKFSSEPRSRQTWCHACGNHINRFVYHCRDEDLDLHPCCLELEKKMVSDGVRFRLCDKVESKCIWCNRKSLKGKSEGGWSYKSKRNKCHVHVGCVTEMILQNWKTGEFKDDDTLTLSLKNPQLHLGLSSGGGQKYLKIAKALMSAVVAILLGDPTMLNLIIS